MKGFTPIVDKDTEVLILGSFPSIKSLEEQQYYGHKQNHFWKVLGVLLHTELYNIPYEERIPILLKHNVGIWDVYRGCERKGSLDSDIKNAKLNDFNMLKKRCPNIKTIIFNGKTAAKHMDKILIDAKKFEAPSTSPAYTIPIDEKIRLWRVAFDSSINP